MGCSANLASAHVLLGCILHGAVVRTYSAGCSRYLAVSQAHIGLRMSCGCCSQSLSGVQLLDGYAAPFQWFANDLWLCRMLALGYSLFMAGGVAVFRWVASAGWLCSHLLSGL